MNHFKSLRHKKRKLAAKQHSVEKKSGGDWLLRSPGFCMFALPKFAPRLLPVTDQFIAHRLERTLVLKACGFIEDQRARIVDVDEGKLVLRIGSTWLERCLKRDAGMRPLEIRLNFRPVTDSLELDRNRYRRPGGSYSAVDVSIRAAARGWTAEEFHDASRRLLWLLRSFFMAC